MKKLTFTLVFIIILAVLFYPSENNNGTENDSQNDSIDSSGECFEGEYYDDEVDVCILECNQDQDCDINSNEFFKVLEEEQSEAIEEEILEEEKVLREYVINNDSIVGEIADRRDSEAWDLFVELFPEEYTEYVSGYQIISDGVGGTLALVEQNPDDIAEWILAVDLDDVYNIKGEMNKYDFSFTLIHEFAHVLTLNDEEIKPDSDLFLSNEDEYGDVYSNKELDCDSFLQWRVVVIMIHI
ncbi:MAG: hypothetical protein Q9M91_01695 [Candidatus Dojkabacteria bacterium]|nr:hypothetical protein [Candidatus Dojkabacteria bacterium]